LKNRPKSSYDNAVLNSNIELYNEEI